ncbi:MAG: ABC transporter substrate-binding protein, partial [Comamonadaceae bacterium]
MRRVAMLLFAVLLLPSVGLAQANNPVKLKVGMVAAVDMLALPIAVERGFFEKYGLDV